MPIKIETEINIGNILTIITILGGVLAWFINEFKKRSYEKLDYAKGGSVRLILRLLRERKQRIVSCEELFSQYQSPQNKKLRKEYCRFDFKFQDFPMFEAALYALDEEGKIRYAGGKELIFKQQSKLDNELSDTTDMILSEGDKKKIMITFISGFDNKDTKEWDLNNLARVANKLYPQDTQDFLRKKLDSDDFSTKSRAIKLMEILFPR